MIMTDNSPATDEEVEAAADCILGGSTFTREDRLDMARAAINAASRIRAETAKNSGEVVKTSLKTFQEAARDLVVKNGWQPGNNLSLHSVIQLMANFGMMVDRGEVGCDWPQCGCCADAACGDTVTVMDATPANSRTEAIGARAKELLEHFQLVPMSAQQRKVYNNLRALIKEGE